MKQKRLLAIFMFSVLMATGAVAFGIAEAQVQFFTSAFINPDGSVTGTNNIQRNGNVYTLTGNISGGISVQKSYLVIDGAGYTIDGNGQDIGVPN